MTSRLLQSNVVAVFLSTETHNYDCANCYVNDDAKKIKGDLKTSSKEEAWTPMAIFEIRDG